MVRAAGRKSRSPTNRQRDSKPQALPVHPWSEQHGFLRDRLGGAQILSGRLSSPAVRDDVERHFLTLVEGAHARAFDRADMNEDVFAAVFRLNESEALLVVKPLHNTRVHRVFPSLTGVHVGVSARCFVAIVPVRRFLETFLKRARPSAMRRSGPVVRPSIDFGNI